MSDKKAAMEMVIATLMSDITISTPIYFPNIQTESEADSLSKELPLIYLWNEDPDVGSFSLSINTSIISFALKQFIPRLNPIFNSTRDDIAEILRRASIDSVMKTCEATNLPVSVVFSVAAYENVCEQDKSDSNGPLTDTIQIERVFRANAIKKTGKLGIPIFWIVIAVLLCLAVARNAWYFLS